MRRRKGSNVGLKVAAVTLGVVLAAGIGVGGGFAVARFTKLGVPAEQTQTEQKQTETEKETKTSDQPEVAKGATSGGEGGGPGVLPTER